MKTRQDADVFQYGNCRAYLRAVFAERTESEYGFSYRAGARAAGLGAPSYLKRVSADERNLTPEMFPLSRHDEGIETP